MKHLTKEGLDYLCGKINLSTTKLGGLSDTDVIRKKTTIVNGTSMVLLGTHEGESFSIYAPTYHGGQDGLILTSKLGTAPEWKAPSSITVGKATQLVNTRKIWGQSFNGTGNVDGDLTANGNIKAIGGGVSAQGIADFGIAVGSDVKNVQTIDITSTGASSYTFTHSLATEDLVVVAITVSGGTVYDGYNIAFGNTIPQSNATTVSNFIRWKTNSASSITLTFRSSSYAPATGQKIRVTIMRANY